LSPVDFFAEIVNRKLQKSTLRLSENAALILVYKILRTNIGVKLTFESRFTSFTFLFQG